MSPRETYAERKTREVKRDTIREFAYHTAAHTAFGDLNRVERVTRDDWPCVQFAHPVTGHRCECGAQMFPLPTFSKRWGMLPTWYCSFCNLDDVVKACELIAQEAERVAAGGAAE